MLPPQHRNHPSFHAATFFYPAARPQLPRITRSARRSTVVAETYVTSPEAILWAQMKGNTMQGTQHEQHWREALRANLELLELGIQARFEVIFYELTSFPDFLIDNIDHGSNARYLAALIANHTDTLPPILAGSDLLQEWWQDQRYRLAECEEWLAECEAEDHALARQTERKAAISALIAASAWSSLNLPTPHEALAALMAGDAIAANGHTVQYDAADRVTWFTNAYGIDGALCNTPTLGVVTSFLTAMANGVDYGPVP